MPGAFCFVRAWPWKRRGRTDLNRTSGLNRTFQNGRAIMLCQDPAARWALGSRHRRIRDQVGPHMTGQTNACRSVFLRVDANLRRCRYITKAEGNGEARYEIVFEQARVVQQIVEWVGRDRLTIGEVRRRLIQQGVKTRTGKTVWDRTTVWDILKNPAYKRGRGVWKDAPRRTA